MSFGTKKHGLKELKLGPSSTDLPAFPSEEMTLRNLSSSTLSRSRPSSQSVRMRWLHHSPFRSATMTKRYVTAAGSDKLFTLDAATGKILAAPLSVPYVAARPDEDHAWFSTLLLTRCPSSISRPHSAQDQASITLHDPRIRFKRGALLQHSQGLHHFLCASCHPDGHTDQLLWVLDTPITAL